jgi:hypothetical protein
MADKYFCGFCDAYRQANTNGHKCEKCEKPTVTVGRVGNREETYKEVRERWQKLYGRYR